MKNKTDIVIRMVAEHFHVPVKMLKSKIKLAPAVKARHTAAYLLTSLLELSTTQAAHALGYNDHGSTIHAIKAIRNRLDTEPWFKSKLGILIHIIKLKINESDSLPVEHVNVLAGCNIAGRIRVAIEAIKNPKKAHRPAVDELKELLKFVSNPQPKLRVLTEVRGGCAEVTSCPDCVDATIIDHDNA